MSSESRNDMLKALEETDPGGHLLTVLQFYAFDLENGKYCHDMAEHCVLEELQGTVEIYRYGSVVTGLALKESDIDLFLRPISSPPILYDDVVKRLRRSKCFWRVTPIRKARVPVIRCAHNATGLRMDLNMSNSHGVFNSRFVAELLKCDRRLHHLFLFLKIWATKLKLIGRHHLTSHCLVSMIIFSLQVHQLLPSVQQMQATCPPIIYEGNNFAYKLQPAPRIPEDMSTQQLINNFFGYYTTFDFGKFVVSPFLGRCLNRHENEHLAFQLHCKNICVQDPFELNLNLAKSVSQRNLDYFRQCLMLSAQAYSDKDLKWQPKKLYDYLFFGIAEKLTYTPDNQIVRQPTRVPDAMQNTSAPHIPMTTFIQLTTEDYQGLLPIREVMKTDKEEATFFTWHACQLATIIDVLTEVYGLKIESQENQLGSSRMLISGQVDTWSRRNFIPMASQSFLAHQLQQSRKFSTTRPGNPAYAVNVRAYLTVTWYQAKKQLQIKMEPVSDPLRNAHLERLFYEFKRLLNRYSFKEQASIWSLDTISNQEILILKIILVALFFLFSIIPGPLFLIILFILAIQFRNFLTPLICRYYWRHLNTLRFKKNELHPKYPIYR
ncbi:uncharacterized protein [Drosophila kikkawai]|uniref:Poly(A) RNA polymerase, mitochondrial n=1 Tax=Drosophila kikkawai TaxID=30033 RepID=A0A6P4I510_DROKI|nr:uncharacterized protein LOC108075336 [Drosophila kikkawai]